MLDMNEANLMGRATAAPEVGKTDSGRGFAAFILATNRRYRRNGEEEMVERTEFHRIVAWGGHADIAETRIEKGTALYVRGRIVTRRFVPDDGSDRYVTEIVVNGGDGLINVIARGRPAGGDEA